MKTIREIFEEYKADRIIHETLLWKRRGGVDCNSEIREIERRMQFVENALDVLSEDERGVMYWRYIYAKPGWEYKAIATLYVSRSTMYLRLQSARQKFIQTYRRE